MLKVRKLPVVAHREVVNDQWLAVEELRIKHAGANLIKASARNLNNVLCSRDMQQSCANRCYSSNI